MIYIVTALALEAAPIIEYFKFKKDMNEHAYFIYKNTDISLIVGGIGKVKCAMASRGRLLNVSKVLRGNNPNYI